MFLKQEKFINKLKLKQHTWTNKTAVKKLKDIDDNSYLIKYKIRPFPMNTNGGLNIP